MTAGSVAFMHMLDIGGQCSLHFRALQQGQDARPQELAPFPDVRHIKVRQPDVMARLPHRFVHGSQPIQ